MIPRALVYLEVARAHSALGAALAVWVGGRLAGASWAAWWLAPMAVAFLLSAAGNAFNDSHDAEIDHVNRPGRPIPRGAISAPSARRFAYACAASALVLAPPFGWVSAAGTIAGIILLFLYTTHLKGVPLLGNLTVGILTAMALGYGGVLAGDIPAILLPAASLTMLFTGREVLKTIHDVKGDRSHAVRTVATEGGPRVALLLATGMVAGALLLLARWAFPAPSFWLVLTVATAASALVLAPLWQAPGSRERVARALRWSKALGLLMLVAFSIWRAA